MAIIQRLICQQSLKFCQLMSLSLANVISTNTLITLMITRVITCYFMFIANQFDAIYDSSFITTWQTDNYGESNSTSITIPTYGQGYSYKVDWDNDGTFDQFDLNGSVTHDFGIPGKYTIRIQGSFPRIYFNNKGDAQKIILINNWGKIKWESMENAFNGASNLQLDVNISDSPDLSLVKDVSGMFQGALSFNQDIGNWNMVSVKKMNRMFQRAVTFNQDINSWDTSNVESMSSLFEDAISYDKPLSNWNTSNVMDMSYLFQGATLFNQELYTWNTSKVYDMSNMFLNAASFSQEIGSWDTSNVKDMSFMFLGAISFDQDISSWNVSKVSDMMMMFDNSGLTDSSYEHLLINWATKSLYQNVTFGAKSNKSCSLKASSSKAYIIEHYNWEIIDSSINCTNK